MLFDIDGKLFVDRNLSMIEDYFNLNMEFNMLEKDLITFNKVYIWLGKNTHLSLRNLLCLFNLENIKIIPISTLSVAKRG